MGARGTASRVTAHGGWLVVLARGLPLALTRTAKGVTAVFCRRGFCHSACKNGDSPLGAFHSEGLAPFLLTRAFGITRSKLGRLTGDHSFRAFPFAGFTSSASISGIAFCALDGIDISAQSGVSIAKVLTLFQKHDIKLTRRLPPRFGGIFYGLHQARTGHCCFPSQTKNCIGREAAPSTGESHRRLP